MSDDVMELTGLPKIAGLKWKQVGSLMWVGTLSEYHYSIRLADEKYILCVKGEDMPGVSCWQDAADHAQHHMEGRIIREIFNGTRIPIENAKLIAESVHEEDIDDDE